MPLKGKRKGSPSVLVGARTRSKRARELAMRSLNRSRRVFEHIMSSSNRSPKDGTPAGSQVTENTPDTITHCDGVQAQRAGINILDEDSRPSSSSPKGASASGALVGGSR